MPVSFDTALNATTTILGTAKLVNDLSGHKLSPISGYQYTKAGAQYMDQARALLLERQTMNSTEYLIPAQERVKLHIQHQELVDTREVLERETEGYIGSIKHWNRARVFYQESHQLKTEARSASDRAMNSLGKDDAYGELVRANADTHTKTTSSDDPYLSEDDDNTSIYYMCEEASSSKLQLARQDHYPGVSVDMGGKHHSRKHRLPKEAIHYPDHSSRSRQDNTSIIMSYPGSPGPLQPYAAPLSRGSKGR